MSSPNFSVRLRRVPLPDRIDDYQTHSAITVPGSDSPGSFLPCRRRRGRYYDNKYNINDILRDAIGAWLGAFPFAVRSRLPTDRGEPERRRPVLIPSVVSKETHLKTLNAVERTPCTTSRRWGGQGEMWGNVPLRIGAVALRKYFLTPGPYYGRASQKMT
jgi:hypothetical protein